MKLDFDIPTKYLESLYYVIQGLHRKQPDKDSPAEQLLSKLIKAVNEYEINFLHNTEGQSSE